MEEIHEQWRPIVNYEGLYEVSNLGRVRSLSRITPGRWGKTKLSPGSVLKGHVMKNGYVRVDLSRNGERKHFFVHRLVAGAFIELVDGKTIINHIDNNPANNLVSNLEWCTHKENSAHAQAQGRLKGSHGKTWATHCPRGHEYTPENTRIAKRVSKATGRIITGRTCRICERTYAARRLAYMKQQRTIVNGGDE